MSDLKADVRELRADMKSVNERLGRMEVGLAKIDERLRSIPNAWQFSIALIAAFAASAAVFATLAK
jgi:predicted nuclease with TOPRIM domain